MRLHGPHRDHESVGDLGVAEALAGECGTFFGFADPDGNTWAVQELRVRAEKPLIPVEARGRFGA
jgi:hypothetical protein